MKTGRVVDAWVNLKAKRGRKYAATSHPTGLLKERSRQSAANPPAIRAGGVVSSVLKFSGPTLQTCHVCVGRMPACADTLALVGLSSYRLAFQGIVLFLYFT